YRQNGYRPAGRGSGSHRHSCRAGDARRAPPARTGARAMSEDDALWRRLVFPPDYRNPTPAARYHLTVIGAGPAGRVAAIATGARAYIPPLRGLGEVAPLADEAVFELTEQPRRLAVLGAGAVGCELAQAFARLGTQVALLELGPQILPQDEPDAAQWVAEALVRDGVRLRLGARVTGAARTSAGKVLMLADGTAVAADEVLVAAGRARNVEDLALPRAGVRVDSQAGIAVDARLRTSHPHIYAAGDVCAALQFTHAAAAQARIAVRNA